MPIYDKLSPQMTSSKISRPQKNSVSKSKFKYGIFPEYEKSYGEMSDLQRYLQKPCLTLLIKLLQSDKGYKGTVVNPSCPSFNDGSFVITLTVLKGRHLLYIFL